MAYRSSAFRSATFALRKPVPTGVVSGPLIPMPLLRIDSSTRSGIRLALAFKDSLARLLHIPVETGFRWIQERGAWLLILSGPIPSPGMNVTSYAIRSPTFLFCGRDHLIRRSQVPKSSPPMFLWQRPMFCFDSTWKWLVRGRRTYDCQNVTPAQPYRRPPEAIPR